MKHILIILFLLTAGCAAQIEVVSTDPQTGIIDHVTIKSARRTAVSTSTVTVLTGQVLIDDATVQALAKTNIFEEGSED